MFLRSFVGVQIVLHCTNVPTHLSVPYYLRVCERYVTAKCVSIFLIRPIFTCQNMLRFFTLLSNHVTRMGVEFTMAFVGHCFML